MIRVLHVIASLHFGGSQAFVMNLYQNIDKSKVQFDFVVIPEEKKDLYDVVEKMGGKIYVMPRYNILNHFSYVNWWNDFFNAHREYKIVHGHVRSTGAIFLSIAKKHGLVTVSHSHSTSNGKGLSGYIKDLMQLPIRNIADYFFACSEDAGKWLFGEKVIKQSNYKVIPNGICIDKFKFNLQKRKYIRRELGIQPDEIVIGHVGRFVKAKNHEFLLILFAAYTNQNNKSRLLLLGDGELLPEIKRLSIELGIEEKVLFLGSKFNTEDFYQAMDAFVFPSLWEGLGIVAIEAQANGLPCVVSNHIPSEAVVTENVVSLSLECINDWVRELQKIKIREYNGISLCSDRRLLHYDMKDISKKMQQFYLSIVEGKNE